MEASRPDGGLEGSGVASLRWDVGVGICGSFAWGAALPADGAPGLAATSGDDVVASRDFAEAASDVASNGAPGLAVASDDAVSLGFAEGRSDASAGGLEV